MTDQTETLEPPRAALPRSRAGPSGRLRRPAAVFVADGYRVLLVVAVAVCWSALVVLLPHSIQPDTWLALTDGRMVASLGIPHHVTLTLYPHGRAWVDQQWGAQLLMYWLDRLGGMGLVGAINVALVLGALAGAVGAATALGACARSVVRVLPAAALCVVLSVQVRTESYAYPLFVALIYVLARDSRRSSRAVFWSLPLLVLWGNLHGSASLGAGLVSLRGLTLLWETRRALTSRALWARGMTLIVGAPLCLLATPYGLSMVSYYRATVLNPAFRAYLTEWQPVTSVAATAVLVLALAAIVVWSFGHHSGRTTLWERCATLVLIAGAIIAVRNVVWFGFAALIVLPLSIDGAVRARGQARARARKPRPSLNLALGAVVVLLLAPVLARTFATSEASLERSYPPAALAAVRRSVADPTVRVFATEDFADWLLWKLPELHGRVAYDVSYEQLTHPELARIQNLKTLTGLDWAQAARGYRVLVINPSVTPDLLSALRREPDARVLYDRRGVAVIER